MSLIVCGLECWPLGLGRLVVSYMQERHLAWHLLLNYLPSKDILLKRGVIPATSQSCVGWRGNIEAVAHPFLHCDRLFSSNLVRCFRLVRFRHG